MQKITLSQGQLCYFNECRAVFFNILLPVSSIMHLAGSVVLSEPVTVNRNQRQQKDRYGFECECVHVHLRGFETLLSWYRKTLTVNVNSKAA